MGGEEKRTERCREATVTESTPHLPPWTIEELAEDALDRAEREQALAHVRHCARCAADLDASRALIQALGSLPSFDPSPAFADAVMSRVALPVAATAAVARRRWLPQTRKGWMRVVAGAFAPLVPLLALLAWLAGRGVSPGPMLGGAARWAGEAGWSALVRATAWVVQSGFFQWVVTTGSDLVGGTQGLSIAGALFAVAVPVSAWMLVRLLRTPSGGFTHAH